MATFKAVVRPYKRADGTYRVYIRVTHLRAHKDIPTPFYVTPSQVTRSLRLKDQFIIDKLEDKMREYRSIVDKIGFLANDVDVKHLVSLFDLQVAPIDFFTYAQEEIHKMRAEGRDGTVHSFETAVKSLYRYNNECPLYFSDMTKDYIMRYFESLSHLKPNSQISYISKIKELYHRAQRKYNDDTLGIISVRYGVFDNIRLPSMETAKGNVIRRVEDMQKIIDEPYHKSWSGQFAKDMFILSFVCFGTNMADWIDMKNDQYKDGILSYRRKKTGRISKENADIQIKVPEVGRIILDKYSGDKEYLINYGAHARNILPCSQIHYYFAKAGLEEMPSRSHGNSKNSSGLTFYASRHTMASFSRNICKVEYMTVHEMLNHVTPQNLRTTDAYLWKDYTAIWEANEKLIALFDWSFYLKQHSNHI